MKEGGSGGANTKTGIIFEGKTDLVTFLNKQTGYTVKNDCEVYFCEKYIASIFKKYSLYKYLKKCGIDWNTIISKRLLPDDAIFVIANNTMHIIECKFQKCEGSVDEKLQTCDFKKKQYKKLLASLNVEVEYIYLLSEWYKKPCYKDVLDYIQSVNCDYYFEYIPLQRLGLPVPE